MINVTGIRSVSGNFNLNDQRSRIVAVNIVKSFIVKFLSTIVTLALVPVSLHYVEKETYGVWLTITSVITWFNVFDFGLANGLTNRLSEALAKNERSLAVSYLSTTYVILFLIIICLGILFAAVSPLVNWNTIFNTTIDKELLRKTVNYTFLSFALLFFLKPLTALLMAKQKHFLSNLIQVSGNLAALLLIYFANYLPVGNKFFYLSIILTFTYPFFLFIFSLALYNSRYRNLKPSFKTINLSHSKSLFGLSLKFFIIQICVIVVFTSNNFLIAHLIDNSNVTYYNIAYRLYGTVSIFQLLFLQPLWPAFTQAYTLKDFSWIQKVVARLNKMNFILCGALLLLFLFHKIIYRIWIGSDTSIPFEVDLLLAIYFVPYLFMQSYVYFINGSGKLNLQTLISVSTFVLQFPLVYLLVSKAGFGISGILILNIFWAFISLILWKKQYNIILSGRGYNKIWQ